MVCTTGKTEINYETKTAGGCGVAPFPSLPPFLSSQPRSARNALRRLKRKADTGAFYGLKPLTARSVSAGRWSLTSYQC
ncbi:hypothetical protein E1K98_12955 [Salmonella enterica subsp. enterica serovar Fluntern]|nr:hypothetical protein [Salmonella enterica subsp. enterica serovar Tennessee]EAA1887277.1 hypothetical protein [Salmonella enterica subsp. enterica serovar Fluntern]EAB1662338.1 hypothetical protein [Salmonella enterica]EBX0323299.1 hypothetical protein [Salmonella enterica subsp. enterica serovar Ago]ECI0551714.1 hypothetical protein [Salmonella enterica subsp. enterica]EEE2135685.1 hypothetical protein [Salmonella enterica subsp. enterica serovar Beaudesert]